MYSPSTEYPVDLTLDFECDGGYRAAIHRLFLSRAGQPDVDVSTCALYDELVAQTFIDAVLRETINKPEFAALYTKAAADLMSEDPENGMVVLLAYDNVVLFHSCLAAFFRGATFADNEGYATLAEKYHV
jgi:hypothetical protein